MNVLGIETSCDETSVAIINSDRKLLSHIVFSQTEDHEKYGGVVPEIAARSHFAKLNDIFSEVLMRANLSVKNLDVISATAGPGLIGGVLDGTMFARGLAVGLNKPYVAVNHLEGHLLSTLLENDVEFPFLKLLVSGGHCLIVEVRALGDYKVLSTTIDDAPGEAFDKVAKMLSLGYPGGAFVEKCAVRGDERTFDFPKPLLKDKSNPNFSFSGLKTAVRNTINSFDEITDDVKADICASFQYAATKSLLGKLELSMDEYLHDNKVISVAGGVAANKYLRNAIKDLCDAKGFDAVFPSMEFCVDNGAMIALAGLMRAEANKFSALDFNPRSRWSLEDLN